MSKTFKALQRAAAEHARRQRPDADEALPVPEAPTPPSAAMARMYAITHPRGAAAARPPAPDGTQALRSEMDPQLRELLESSFRPTCPNLQIGADGWVRGQLDREALITLRRRHALLHCLHKSDQESFWFWGSARDAAALAEAAGYPLDAEA